MISVQTIPAFAWDSNDGYHHSSGAEVINGQLNLGNIFSKMNLEVAHVNGNVVGVVTAVGNTAEIITMTDSKVTNTQVNKGAVSAKLNATVNDVDNNVVLQATAVCNAVDVSTDPNVTKVNSVQVCVSPDPSAQVNAQVFDVGGNVDIGATAIANQLQVDSNAPTFPVDNWQENNSAMVATVNAAVGDVSGDVTAAATAVGNSAQIIQYDTGGH